MLNIVDRYLGNSCHFTIGFTGEDLPDHDLFVIPNTSLKADPHDPNTKRGKIAVSRREHWLVTEAQIIKSLTENSVYFYITCDSIPAGALDRIAYPIDPRMTEEDITDATRFYPNADNTGWLFAHASVGHHQDHELLLMAAIEGVFRPVFRQYGYDHLAAPTGTHATLAKERHTLLVGFYGKVIQEARKNARAKHLGERHKELHPEEGHLATELRDAYNTVKAKWVVDHAADLQKMTGAFSFIETTLNIPDPETRWDKDARIKAAAKTKSSGNP